MLSVLKVWSGEDSVSAAASDVTPCVRHVVRHEQRVVGGDVDGGGVISKFFCGGHLAAGPVLKDEHIRGAVDGGDGHRHRHHQRRPRHPGIGVVG